MTNFTEWKEYAGGGAFGVGLLFVLYARWKKWWRFKDEYDDLHKRLKACEKRREKELQKWQQGIRLAERLESEVERLQKRLNDLSPNSNGEV